MIKKICFACALALGLWSCNSQDKEQSQTNTNLTADNVQEVSQSKDEHAGHNHDGHDGHDHANEAGDGKFAVYEFETTEYDFGTVKEGKLVEYTFKFKNTGEVPLVIQEATGSCGCTVPEKPEKPIPAGETGEIKVKFDSKGRPGTQSKTVTLTANTKPEKYVLKITGFVEGSAVSNSNGPLKQ